MMSGTGVAEADKVKSLMPATTGAGLSPPQPKVKLIGVAPNARLGVKARTKLCVAPAAIETGVFGKPVALLVAGSGVWQGNTAGPATWGAMLQAVPAALPVLMTLANAVAVLPS